MKKSEMFDILVDKVCEVCEVDKNSMIMGSKRHSVVEARVLAVQYLRRIGLLYDDIAEIVLKRMNTPGYIPDIATLKKKSKAVEKMFNSYSSYCIGSYSFCLMSKEIQEFCHEKYNGYYLSWMKHLPNIV